MTFKISNKLKDSLERARVLLGFKTLDTTVLNAIGLFCFITEKVVIEKKKLVLHDVDADKFTEIEIVKGRK